jgi:hypothetical protein
MATHRWAGRNMQLLILLFCGNTMNKWSLSILAFLFLSIGVVLPQNAFAIGKWVQGIVSESPWNDGYTYIQINNDTIDTRYTIMEGAKMVYVYEKNGAQYENPMSVSSIRRGDTLVFMVEGNRIYQIKRIR